MSFSVFPDASLGPLSLGPQQISAPLDFPELAGGTPPTVYLRIVMLGPGCRPPDAGQGPTFQLRAGTGDPVEPALDGDALFVYDNPQGNPPPVAQAQLFLQPENVYAINITVYTPGSSWQLRIGNKDDTERTFTWVVADNEADSARPWLNLPQVLNFDGDVGTVVTRSLDVPNLGTGKLTISLGGLDDPRFSIQFPPADIVPNHCGKMTIAFHSPDSEGRTAGLYTANSNDAQATESAHHNNLIHLQAKTTRPDQPLPDVSPCRVCHPNRCPDFVGHSGGDLHAKCERSVCQHIWASHLQY
ncbi:hypothetical protein AB0L06_35245 [Spirillospora sp. NPDC052269]